ncbi:MAG: acetyl-CoA carboxylase subunit beta [Candidatus Wallbacteria bacterium GWC2_49_35]|uniref:Acetyl-coenzyme A carboxylase carboxyl transferase subunit beta n=1 Tax=Candidatus Wallbacteria bacterium GWC2_49_35 TaxID=1817813 RepID=A0A1F7WP76_9BACT|nr:MAG: acetyl-CoA carboxylase subunit beta [Candidatus Wallbacteria bacterium GWC2_49_35]HBC74345.1 acetyl-CoA carboxylase carboxyl transferase subunit beta [Candidatus Wallbacteria bacterium]
MGWFSKLLVPDREKSKVPQGLWEKCPGCQRVIYKKDLEKNLWVCAQCGYHFKISARDRIDSLVEPGSFKEMNSNIGSLDPLEFTDTEKYCDRYKKARDKSKMNDACLTGTAMLGKNKAAIAVMDFFFMGGSMGAALGEKITLMTEFATENRLPLIIVSTSGGARMQEGIFSLMQMAKTSAALARHAKAGLMFISVLVDPTTGGVTASYSMLGDIIIAEPNALICFAGPRVIEQTIRQKLPEGFQRSEFLLKHGIIDMVVPRSEMHDKLEFILDFINSGERAVE